VEPVSLSQGGLGLHNQLFLFIFMIKLTKTSFALAWLGFIYILSDIPYEQIPIKTTSAQQTIAHIFLYGVLAYLVLLALESWQKSKIFSWKLYFYVIAFCFFYGITDEYHQSFIAGRFVSGLDLFFDAVGAGLGVILFWSVKTRGKPKLLLHICCAGCGAYVSQLLKRGYRVVLYFYNPNIYPAEEYNKRLTEARSIAKKFNLKLIEGEYTHKQWLESVKGYENEPERGERCLICYQDRLEQTAKLAQKKKFNYFSTTLTISPHKDAQAISRIGKEIARKYQVDPSTSAQDLRFLNQDFKKQDGFKKSVQLSKELGLYRQDYCGCEYSYKTTNQLQIYK